MLLTGSLLLHDPGFSLMQIVGLLIFLSFLITVQYENFGYWRSWIYWLSPSWQIDGKREKWGQSVWYLSMHRSQVYLWFNKCYTTLLQNLTVCLPNQVIVVDNFFTGSKDNLRKWIGHPRFELIRHGMILASSYCYHLQSDFVAYKMQFEVKVFVPYSHLVICVWPPKSRL